MPRKADPTRARRGTGHRPKPGETRTTDLPVPAVVVEDAAAIPVPDDVADDVAAMYRRIVSELAPRGLRDADHDALLMMCHSAHIHAAARRVIAEKGVVVAGPKGPMVNPMIKVARDEAATYLRLANEYGLTLAARLRLGLMQLAGESILASLSRDLDDPGSPGTR